jgi:CRP-like cAMP-binding protein
MVPRTVTSKKPSEEETMAENALADVLSKNPWFQALAPKHFQALLAVATEKRWRAGQIIFREGDQADYLYLILSGQIALEIYVPGQGRITILTLGEAGLFGWSAVLPVIGTRTAGARAMLDTWAVAFDSEGLRAACEADHDLGYHVYRRLNNVVAGRLSATRLQLLDMYAKSRG